ncbi:hypothetical protein HW555_003619 [Spodoptera exigua]|uniref:Zinc finger PHD-type domain-containing protein n=1 Tax=Spodoptera exigua TaxID=7107 RepID=A0A835LD38_SPOEX|nr:hypothetical protein HW555_003619 [Spodoptera exigua]
MPPKRALWSQDDLVSAVRAVQRGIMSTYAAAERYKIPRRTIRNHLQSGILVKSLGRKPILNPEQEADLVKRLIRYAEISLPVTPRILRRLVYKYCVLNNIKHNFDEEAKCAGKDWFKAFMKRHPDISLRKAQFMNPARAQKLNKFIVNDHFEKLKEVYDKLNLRDHPERIYNMDEKGCRLTIHHQQNVLAKKGAKRVHLQSSEHAESVTIAGCVNALGTAIPPMVIFKGQRLKPELYDNLPPGSLVEKSAKGYMTNELFKTFLKHLAKYKCPGPCLLIFDGAACHLDLSIVDVFESLDISLYCLPSNTTHELQPLDKAVYRSFEHHWDAEVLAFMDQNRDKKLTKARFNVILSSVWSKCMTHGNITSGFKATGLYPFNPQAIPETAFAPSILSEVPAPSDGEQGNLQSLDNSGIRTQERESPSILAEVSTPDLVEANDNYVRQTTPEAEANDIFAFDVGKENVPLDNYSRPKTPILSSSFESPAVLPNQQPPSRSTMNRSYYHQIYGTSSSDSEDDVPLARLEKEKEQIKSGFHVLMPTPAKVQEKTPTVRRKAINFRGTPVTKDLFDKFNEGKKSNAGNKNTIQKKKKTKGQKRDLGNSNLQTPSRANKTKSSRGSDRTKDTEGTQASWYCHACQENRMDDMRQCSQCPKWYHEECVGLSVDDYDDFVCPGGC